MNQLLGTAWACPYCLGTFVSPAARLRHLEEAHAEIADTSGAAAAVAELKAVLERTKARYEALMKDAQE